jgi:hypothetical protein
LLSFVPTLIVEVFVDRQPSAATYAGDLRVTAASGGFTVSEAGARPILAAIAHCRTELDAREAQLRLIAEQPLVGSSPVAQQVAGHVRTVASGDEWSFDTCLADARAYLDELEAGLNAAIAGYTHADQEQRAEIGKAGPS